MRFLIVFWGLLMITAAFAESPEIVRAEQEVARTRELVSAGVLPRMKLEESEKALAAARDEAILNRTLYGAISASELTEPQAQEMVAAATRCFEREKEGLDQAKALVETGALPRLALSPLLSDLDRSRRVMDLANSRLKLTHELAEMARHEEELQARLEKAPKEAPKIAERYDGEGVFRENQLKAISLAFQKHFSKPLPISARGQTSVHRALGFDHRGRVDVALDPDSPGGVWLRDYLKALKIPYFAFRGFVAGSATAAHIHIGPPSSRTYRHS